MAIKIHVQSDGTPHGTKVINRETGEPIEYVRALSFALDANETVGSLLLEVMDFSIELEMDGHIIQQDPSGRVIQAMKVMDETVEEFTTQLLTRLQAKQLADDQPVVPVIELTQQQLPDTDQ